MAGHGRRTAQPCQEDGCMPCLRIFEAKSARRLVLALAEYRQVCRRSADNARARLFGYAGISCGLCGGGGGGGGVTLCFHCYYFVFFAFCRFCRRFCQYCFRYGFASFDDTRKHYQFVTASAVNPVFACTVGRKYNMGNMKCNSQSQRAGSTPSPLRLAPHPHRLTCLHDWVSPLARCISPWKL